MMTAKGLAKLIEECGELQQIAAKKLAYFHTDEHPDHAGSMKKRMEDEIADVIAACWFVMDEFNLDKKFIEERGTRKLNKFRKWHADDSNQTDGFEARNHE